MENVAFTRHRDLQIDVFANISAEIRMLYLSRFRRRSVRQAPVDHNAQATNTGWKNSRAKRS